MKINFIAEGVLEDWYCSVHDETLFYCSDSRLQFKIRQSEDFPRAINFIASYEEEVDVKIFDFIDGLIVGRYVKGMEGELNLPYIRNDVELIKSCGEINQKFHVRKNHLPNEVQVLCFEIERRFIEEIDRFFKVVAWSQGVNKLLSFTNRISFFWNTREDNPQYYLMPLDENAVIELGMSHGIYWDRQSLDDIKLLEGKVQGGISLGHELAREAFFIWNHSPKSGLMLLTSALEVSIKQHISRQASSTSWIFENIPSPPVEKLIKSYIPILHSSNSMIENWSELKVVFKSIKDMVEYRNKIAHLGQLANGVVLSKSDKDKFFQTVMDFLYILDVLEGETWAVAHISSATLKCLRWESTDERFLYRRSKTILQIL